MCIMEVRPGQRNITIAQACAHNANTILGDLEMFQLVAQARKDDGALRAIEQMAQHTRVAYVAMLGYFGEQLAADVQDENGHWDNPAPHEHEHEHGNERTFTQIVHDATDLARPYETR